MCEGVRIDNAGEIARLGLRNLEEEKKSVEERGKREKGRKGDPRKTNPHKPTPKDWHHEVQRQGTETGHK